MKELIATLATGLLYLTAPQRDTRPLAGHVIIVDPGHGGRDSGGQAHGLEEKDITLALSREIAHDLGDAGARVVRTRTGDQNLLPGTVKGNQQRMNLAARVELAQRVHADMFLSIHTNKYSDPSVHGAQVFVGENPSPERQRLGACLQKEMGPLTQTRREVDGRRPLYLMRNLKIPAALIEVGFLSNRREAALLLRPDYRRQIAQAVLRGVECYYKEPSEAVPPQPAQDTNPAKRPAAQGLKSQIHLQPVARHKTA